jgi:general secretion pathway protein L
VCPLLEAAGPIAFADLGRENTDVLVMAGGRPIFARTVSVGVGGLPQSAPRLAAALRQTFAAAGVRAGQPVTVLYLLGGGAAAPGAEAYLSAELGLPVEKLPPLDFDDMTVEQIEFAPRFAKALSLALGLRANPRDLDLRRGPLSFQRGFGFLKEKAPILAGLSATVLISFFFASWAELRSLSYENEGLGEALAALTKRAFGEETSDPERALELLDQRSKGAERDPMPKMDAFDVMVELSKAVPESMVHDVDELDMQREQVKIKGVVGTTAEAQQVADNLKKEPCFKDAKISKVTQAVNSSQQKYVLEFPIKCEEEPKKKKQTAGEEGEEGKEAEDKEAKDKKESEDDEN